MKWRFVFVFIIFLTLYTAVSARLYFIQVHQNDILARAYGIRNIFFPNGEGEGKLSDLKGRGQIFFTDRSGTDVAIALVKKYPSIFISPKEIEDPESVSRAISQIIDIEEQELREKIIEKKKQGSEYLILVERAERSQVLAVQDLKIKGLSIEETPGRFYPFENLGSHLVGYVEKNQDSYLTRGLYGIEQFYDEELSEGEDLYLTIDRAIQDHSESLLERLVNDYGAEGGTIIIQNPKSGAILTMASKPDFDPNEYNKYDIGNFLNPAVQLIYEPGSVFKPFTLSAGLDTGKLTPETTYTDIGSVTLNGKTVHNFENRVYGKITMREMIQNSVNTGAIFAERTVGHDDFYKYLKNYGFTESTDIDLPGEIPGNLRNLVRKDVRAIDFATAAYGQGVAVTPILLISAYSALANDGILMKPFIIKGTEPEAIRRVIKKETADTITDILASAVVKNYVAVIPNYNVAGKTGTAFLVDPNTGKYSEEMIHTFVGYAPATDPQFVVLVKLVRPAHGESAGVTVVPTFKRLAEFLLSYYHIPPDNQKE